MSSSNENIYFYNPSLAASVLFTILYIFPFLYHLYMTIIAPCKGKYTRTGHFIPLLIGVGLEVIGYAIRCASVKKPEDIALYAVTATLIVIAPVFVCASLYLLLHRLFEVGETNQRPEKQTFPFSKIQVKWLPRIFVTLDIISCLTQGSGSGIASAGDWEGSEKDAGMAVLIAGLVLQVVTFAAFLVIVVGFHVTSIRKGRELENGLKKGLMGIYVAGFFIMIRSIFRVIEFAIGIEGYLFTHEWPLYVLEALPMLIAVSILGWYHPARWLPKNTDRVLA